MSITVHQPITTGGNGISRRKAADIAAVAELGEEAIWDCCVPRWHHKDYVALLMSKKLYADAVRFVAHALPKREAVWWGWISAKRAAGADPPSKIKASLESTEKWIAQPDDESGRAAMAAAKEAKTTTAAGCAGMAAFFSGSSLGPAHVPPIPPGEYLTAKAVSGAVIYAAVGKDPVNAPDRFQSFVTQGVEVAVKIKLWEKK
jgi:hypothetical protein